MALHDSPKSTESDDSPRLLDCDEKPCDQQAASPNNGNEAVDPGNNGNDDDVKNVTASETDSRDQEDCSHNVEASGQEQEPIKADGSSNCTTHINDIKRSDVKTKIAAFLRTVDLEKTSAKIVRHHLEVAYGGVDLTSRKDMIKAVIQEVMDEMGDLAESDSYGQSDSDGAEIESHRSAESPDQADSQSGDYCPATVNREVTRGQIAAKVKTRHSADYADDGTPEYEDIRDVHSRRRSDSSSYDSDEVDASYGSDAIQSSDLDDSSDPDYDDDDMAGDELVRTARRNTSKRTKDGKRSWGGKATKRRRLGRDSYSDESSGEEWSKSKKKLTQKTRSNAQRSPRQSVKLTQIESTGDGEHSSRKSAFSKSFSLSAELSDVVGQSEASRAEVVKLVWAYIKDHKLQDPKNKQFAKCDATLMKVIGQRRFRCFGMSKYLTRHLTSIP